MNFNKHYSVEGLHAFLGASKYHWINYDSEKLEHTFSKRLAAQKGDRMHAWAAEAIRMGLRQERNTKTLNSYINDAIGFRMTPETILYYSSNCFGTADAISFQDQILRIFDLKTGSHPASIHQLEVYAALFCLEYKINPYDIVMDLRIYQNDEIITDQGDPKWIRYIMDKIKLFDDRIEEMKEVMV